LSGAVPLLIQPVIPLKDHLDRSSEVFRRWPRTEVNMGLPVVTASGAIAASGTFSFGDGCSSVA